jgi:hypothetical protein
MKHSHEEVPLNDEHMNNDTVTYLQLRHSAAAKSHWNERTIDIDL